MKIVIVKLHSFFGITFVYGITGITPSGIGHCKYNTLTRKLTPRDANNPGDIDLYLSIKDYDPRKYIYTEYTCKVIDTNKDHLVKGDADDINQLGI